MTRLEAALPKARYLAAGAFSKFSGRIDACPSCGSVESRTIARKYAVTELRRCGACHLLFRTPTWSPERSHAFYDDGYQQGFTTDLPDDETLRRLVESRFQTQDMNYGTYGNVLAALGVSAGARIFDFGCSWGYGTWQLQDRGYVVDGFELSTPRAAYAREKLGVSVVDRLPDPVHAYDVFFSAHVLEHVPSVAESIEYGLAMLKSGGLFIAFTPNGSEAFRRACAWIWMRTWGLVHPNFLDDEYYRRTWSAQPHVIASCPYSLNQLQEWGATRSRASIGDLSGGELLFVTVAP